jgi:hypothetical protein
MDISAPAISLPDRPRTGRSGHQEPGRPILHCHLILSQTSAGKVLHYVINGLLALRCSFVRACGRSFVPACGCTGAPRAVAVKAGRRASLAPCSNIARPRLDGAEHGARIKQVGALYRQQSIASDCLGL